MRFIKVFGICSLMGMFLSCSPLDPVDKKPVDSVTKDSATLNVENQIETQPGNYNIFLFVSTATDPIIVTSTILLGSVPTKSSISYRVPIGNWKIAIEGPGQPISPLVKEIGGSDWVVQEIKKNLLYKLKLTTDSGSLNIWNFN